MEFEEAACAFLVTSVGTGAVRARHGSGTSERSCRNEAVEEAAGCLRCMGREPHAAAGKAPQGCEGNVSHAKRLCNLQAWSRFCFDGTSPEPICAAVLHGTALPPEVPSSLSSSLYGRKVNSEMGRICIF